MGEGPCSLGFVVLLTGATVVIAAVSGAWLATPAQASQTIERDSVLMRVDVQDDGTAQWRIEYRTQLDDDNTTRAFRELEADIEENPDDYSRSFFDGINSTIDTAENATGREMEGTNYSVYTEINHLPQRYGVVVYSFTWRGFATVEGSKLQLGDALAGFFLGENERLLVSWPAGYEVDDVHPSPDERRTRAVIWIGPMEFGPDEPRVVVERSAGGWNWSVLAAALVVGLVLVAGAWLYGRRGTNDRRTAGEGSELLSNEERVIQVLRDHGGRAKQQEIVDALDWTEAKTSRVISTLREEGRVDSFRLGRENVLALPDIDE